MASSSGYDSTRRSFFRQALGKAIDPLARAIGQNTPESAAPVRLRPPGALLGEQFTLTCQSCASCVDACPANAIYLLDDNAGSDAGTPIVDPQRSACVLCDGLLCTHVCPSGALKPIQMPKDVKMGMAEVYAPLCLRTSGES